jgi:2-oxoisovalerate dehydrogenase E1 component beta subunit
MKQCRAGSENWPVWRRPPTAQRSNPMTPRPCSVAKTGRCVIVHEAARTGGFGAEIAALIGEHALLSLIAPVTRVTGFDTVIPLPRLEQYYIPSVGRIVAAARKVCRFG